MGLREAKSFCRTCPGHCGMRLEIDDEDRLVAVHPDRDDAMTMGYSCIKGLQAPAAHNAPDRILHPLKRKPDGSFERIGLERALDEIAEKLRATLDRHGPESIAAFRGGGGTLTASAGQMLSSWLEALGSHKHFSTNTIDQSAKVVSAGRVGIWPAGKTPFAKADVVMLFGGNPLVSVSTGGFDLRNPKRRLKDALARGMKLIVVDPRHTETARHADIFLQPYPGEDASIAAGLLRIILDEGWHDKAFCDRHVQDLDELRRAVDAFTPDYVERRAGIAKGDLHRAAALFARDSGRGLVTSGTGTDMAPHSNLAEHLVECLNVVRGCYLREGEEIPNPGVFRARWPRRAQVIPAPRWWEHGYKSRIGGYGMLDNEMVTGILADEILMPGDGQIRCLINDGGNLSNVVPDQRKITKALNALELLVSIEPFMTGTAKLSHYIIPPKMQYERADFPFYQYESVFYPLPFARYTPEIVKPPKESEVTDDWYVFWSLAKRLGRTIVYDGVELDMINRPVTDDLLAILARHAPEPFEMLKSHTMGKVYDGNPQYVEPGDPASADRFTTMPQDVAAELSEVLAEQFGAGPTLDHGKSYSHRLASRRLREVFNSTGRNLPVIRQRMPYNPAYMHPDDLAALGLADGDRVELVSDGGRVTAIVASDATVRPGVVSMSHGWGALPDERDNWEADGANTNLLISTDRDLDPINAMPRMSAIPVNVIPLHAR